MEMVALRLAGVYLVDFHIRAIVSIAVMKV